ncbi:MAG: UDP-3-O-(3-hydroxymyristoyl)glucosamine N-acyltransferase [Acidiphilium sp.]|nr:UDP-3-O-(3-hydroxymyristoyl)glucosamine N-acyltransferase [Acidiphilium sp.]MDD4936836.1 UDP-3-O-(3-hydroxymyristoyl)glucosamine N-acyltransferase [Acidiphilium sp.]
MTDTGGAGLPGDPRFFPRGGPFTLAEIAAAIGAPVPPTAAERRFRGIAPLQSAGPDEISFLDNRKYLPLLAATRAGAVILLTDLADRLPPPGIALPVPQPYLAWAKAGGLFHPPPPATAGRHPTAIVDPSALVDQSAEIGPYAIIEARAEIGPRSVVGSHSVIGPGVTIGADCRIAAHVTVSYALIGDRVTLHPGVRIGQDGFGFAPSPQGFVSVAQLGRVIIGHDVDIGANTTVDRGSAQDTIIGAGTRIDNQVQIAHNVRLGRCCILVAQVGISGSTVFEDFVVVAGQAGFAGHLTIGKGARIGPQAGVMSNIPPGAEMLGSPAQPAKSFFREVAAIRRFARRDKMRHSTIPPAPDSTP